MSLIWVPIDSEQHEGVLGVDLARVGPQRVGKVDHGPPDHA
jgi:hypothetical protein